MENIQNISLDIMDNQVYEYAYAKQYDEGRTLRFTVLENGTPYDLNGVLVTFQAKKPDGTVILNSVNIERSTNAIDIDVSLQLTVLDGKIPYQLQLSKGDVVITTVTGFIKVEKSVIDPNYIESTDEFNALVDALNKANADYTYVMESAKKNADAAKVSEQNAKASATQAMSSENNAQKSETNASLSAKESKSYARGGTGTRDGEDTDNSMYYKNLSSSFAQASATSASNALTSANNAASSAEKSEYNANLSEQSASDASNSASIATQSATNASNSAKAAKESETNSKDSETNAKKSETNAASSASSASESVTKSSKNAESAATSATNASASASKAATSEENAKTSAKQAKESADKAAEIAGGDFIPSSEKGKTNGVATLGGDGKVPATQLPELNEQKLTFTMANQLDNIASGEKIEIILGKLMKWYQELDVVAFSGNYADLNNKPAQLVRLWVNDGSNFTNSGMTIDIPNLNQYDLFIVAGGQQGCVIGGYNGAGGMICEMLNLSNTQYPIAFATRTISISHSNGITISGASYRTANSESTITSDDSRCIPTRIYGIKGVS